MPRTPRLAARLRRRFVVALGLAPAFAAALASPAAASCDLPLPSQLDPIEYSKALADFVADESCYADWAKDKAWRSTGPFIADGPTKETATLQQSYATHSAGFARIWYSPGVYEWLRGGRVGTIADGEMILKKMCKRNAEDLRVVDCVNNTPFWAVMVREAGASWDGWYWSGATAFEFTRNYPSSSFGQYCLNCHASTNDTLSTYSDLDNIDGPLLTYVDQVNSMGSTTLTESLAADFESTQAEHIEPPVAPAVAVRQGMDSNTSRVTIRVDPVRAAAIHDRHELDDVDDFQAADLRATGPAPKRLSTPSWAPSGVPLDEPAIQMPGSGYDHVVQGPRPDGHKQFLTSDACIGCHAASQSNSAMPNMVLPLVTTVAGDTAADSVKTAAAAAKPTTEQIDLSPYGEWRYSAMGISGRDPVFFAQLEFERSLHPEIADSIDDKCLSCHGIMGQRQFHDDLGPEPLFTHDMVLDVPEWAHTAGIEGNVPGKSPYGPNEPEKAKYGALARDGVSCMVCHRIEADGLGTQETYTGLFKVSESATQIYGPYEDVANLPMDHALGLQPQFGQQMLDSNLCGSCHTVFTPNLKVDQEYTRAEFERMAKTPSEEFHEQTTFFEWQNSVYNPEFAPTAQARLGSDAGTPLAAPQTCQQCHMSSEFDGVPLSFRVANIEDDTFADVGNRAADEEIHLMLRTGDVPGERFARHALHGINVFTTSFFAKFPQFLGVAPDNFMNYGVEKGVEVALDNAVKYALTQTARVEVTSIERTNDSLAIDVEVTNLTGHKFPSGVGFRRAFLELEVKANGQTVFHSGATDEWGVIGSEVYGEFKPLPSEFFEDQRYQRHHDARDPIESERQVQIFEELVKNSNGDFTSSFLSLTDVVKDNRLQPIGWSPAGPNAEYTDPEGQAATDPLYLDGSGRAVVPYRLKVDLGPQPELEVTARLWYQALPPSYLAERFSLLDDPQSAPATQSLFYYVVQTQADPIPNTFEDWKLRVGTARAHLPRGVTSLAATRSSVLLPTDPGPRVVADRAAPSAAPQASSSSSK